MVWIETEITIPQTVRGYIAVCDVCGKRGTPSQAGYSHAEDGWIDFRELQTDEPKSARVWHACSWICLRNYANDKANAEPVEVSV